MKTTIHISFRVQYSALAFLLAAVPLRADLLLEIAPSDTMPKDDDVGPGGPAGMNSHLR